MISTTPMTWIGRRLRGVVATPTFGNINIISRRQRRNFTAQRSCWLCVSALVRLAPPPNCSWFPLSCMFANARPSIFSSNAAILYGVILISYVFLLRISETCAITAADIQRGRLGIHAAKRDRTVCWRQSTTFIDKWLVYLTAPGTLFAGVRLLFLPDGSTPTVTAADLWPPAVVPYLPAAVVHSSSIQQLSLSASATSVVRGDSRPCPTAVLNIPSVSDELSGVFVSDPSTHAERNCSARLHDSALAAQSSPNPTESMPKPGAAGKRHRA